MSRVGRNHKHKRLHTTRATKWMSTKRFVLIGTSTCVLTKGSAKQAQKLKFVLRPARKASTCFLLWPKTTPPRPENRRTGEPENRRTGEPENRRTGEPENRRTGEPENRRTGEPENRRTGEPENRR